MDEQFERAKEMLDLPLDIYGGADGGVGFVKLRSFLANMVKKSDEGDENAATIVEVVKRYNRLLEIATQ